MFKFYIRFNFKLLTKEPKKVFIMLLNSSKVHEFNVDLETSLFRDTPKDTLIKNEPRLRQFLLLAYQAQELLDNGKAKNLKQIADWLNITYTKMYLLLNMLMLAPSIQEEILFSDNNLINKIPEYKMNEITREISWNKQKKMWQELKAELA